MSDPFAYPGGEPEVPPWEPIAPPTQPLGYVPYQAPMVPVGPVYGYVPQAMPYQVPGQPYGMYPAPYGVHQSGVPYSDKTKVTAGLLQLLLPLVGIAGVGRLYAGHTAIGVVQLVGILVAWFFSLFIIGIPFLIGFWLWSVIDGIVILASDSRDGFGRILR